MNNKLIKSQAKNLYRDWIILFFGAIFLLFLSYVIMNSQEESNPYRKLIKNFVSYLFLFSSFACVFCLFPAKRIEISEDILKIKSFFGLKIREYKLNEIDSWMIEEKSDRYNKWKILTLILKNKSKVKISNYYYSNSNEIFDALTKGKTENKKLKENKEKQADKKLVVVAFLIGFVCLFVAYNFWIDDSLSPKEVVSVTGNLSEPIKIEEERRIKIKLKDGIRIKEERRNRSLIIKLNQYKDFIFYIGSLPLTETHENALINDYKSGEKISLMIKKEDFETKIMKTKKLSSSEEPRLYMIPVVEISNGNFKYLSLIDYNESYRENDLIGVAFFGFFGLLMIYLGYKGIKYIEKTYK